MRIPGTPDQKILDYVETNDPGCGKVFVVGLCRTRHLAAKAREARGLEYGLCAYCPLIIEALAANAPVVTKLADTSEAAPKRKMCRDCGKRLAKDGYEYCGGCLSRPGTLKFKKEEQPPMSKEQRSNESFTPTTSTIAPPPPPTFPPKHYRPADETTKPTLTCSECGKPRSKNPSGLCRPCSARRNACKAYASIEDRKKLRARFPNATQDAEKANAARSTQPRPVTGKSAPKTGAKAVCNKTDPKVTQGKSNVTLDAQPTAPADERVIRRAEPLPEPADGAMFPDGAIGAWRYVSGSDLPRHKLLRLHETLTTQARELMTRKNADYGANTDPFANFRMSALLHIEPEFGVLLRMQDKMARLVSFLEKGELAVKEESWSDAIIDIINYSVLLCGLLQERITK